MNVLMDENLRREIIMEHYTNPIHRKRVDDLSYEKVNTSNASCIDNLDIYIKIENDRIKDICFDGEACAISTSSTSIMIHELVGKTIDDAFYFIQNFENMINELEYDENILNEALCYQEIYKQGNRKGCAYLPYRGLKEVLTKYQS